MNKRNFFVIALSFIGMLLFPVSQYGCLLIGLAAIAIAWFGVKDRKLTSQTLQPFLLLCGVVILHLLFTIIFAMITGFSSNYQTISNVARANSIVTAILLIFLLIFAIVALVFLCIGKDVPVVGNLARKIAGVENKKQEKVEPKIEETEEDKE